jgi:O-antigen ligase
VLVCWTLFAFAHFYRATVLPLACGIALLAVLQRPAVAAGLRRLPGIVDLALLLALAAMALQLVPLPDGVRERLTPAALAYERLVRLGGAPGGARAISIDPGATMLALVFTGGITLLFWTARAMFASGGLRTLVRALAWLGLLLAPLAVLHHLTPLPVLDLAWGTTPRGLRPFGPFVNRNDFAAWLIMAIPLVLGYAVAHRESERLAGEPDGPRPALDSRLLWLGGAACMMLAALLLSLSRSGLLGAAAGLVFFAWCSKRRLTAGRLRWGAIGLGGIVAGAALYADLGSLAARLEVSFSEGLASRVSIWRQVLPVVRDFWLVGSGAGTFQSIMVPYQTMSRFFYISHADNELLQILAEGGLLLMAPVTLGVAAGIALIRQRLNEDRSAAFWIRLGAAAGIVAVAVQNLVEMTLRVPANAALLAILAAVVVHDRARSQS